MKNYVQRMMLRLSIQSLIENFLWLIGKISFMFREGLVFFFCAIISCKSLFF